jgi:hypothetical protein
MTTVHDPGPVPAELPATEPSTDDLLASLRIALVDAEHAGRRADEARDRSEIATAETWRHVVIRELALAANAAAIIDARLTRGGKLPRAWAKAKRT